MQAERDTQKILEAPENVKETVNLENAAIDCQAFYEFYAERYGEKILIAGHSVTSKEFDKNILNTTEREEAYDIYQGLLSGGMYGTAGSNTLKEQCDFNASYISEPLQ